MTMFDELASLKNCALSILVGDKLGEGATRRVYDLPYNPDIVLKIEHANKEFCNVAEYDVWKTVEGTKLEKFFAPVLAIDTWAGALLMRRTTPVTEEEFEANVKRLPDFLCDIHWGNFGWLDGRVVCHDYGYHSAISNAVDAKRMLAVKHK